MGDCMFWNPSDANSLVGNSMKTPKQRAERRVVRLEKRKLSRFQCAWCDQRLDRDTCGAIYEQCSPEVRNRRRLDCLEALARRQKER